MQTAITISRSPSVLVSEMGFLRSGAVALLFLGLLFGPLFWIPASLFVAINVLANGLSAPAGWIGICLATLWTSVCLMGMGSLFWYALSGMKLQRILHLWPALALLLPYYGLHTLAAWTALYDLVRHPFHWHKTEHGLARSSRSDSAPSVEQRLA